MRSTSGCYTSTILAHAYDYHGRRFFWTRPLAISFASDTAHHTIYRSTCASLLVIDTDPKTTAIDAVAILASTHFSEA